MDNVRNFVKNLYFILIQICFSQLKYITQHVFLSSRNGSVCDRWMQRGARSSFTPSTVRECTFVHDQTGTGARLEIARDAPPQFEQLSQKMGQ